MIIPFKYTFLSGTLLFFFIWLILFLWRKDIRKEMLVMSWCLAIVSLIGCGVYCTVDWWRPQTITGTRVGIEDFLLGFTNGGIAAVLYEVIFKKRLYPRKPDHTNNLSVILLVLFGFMIISFFFWIIGLSSFYASSIAMLIIASYIITRMKGLFLNALMSGVFMSMVSMPIYWTLMHLSPGWTERTWLFDHLSGILITGIPLEDLIFYFFFGCLIGPFYEYWQSAKIKNLHTN